MPLRGDRILVKIPQITRIVQPPPAEEGEEGEEPEEGGGGGEEGEGEEGNAMEGETTQPIVVKMKRGIATWLGLEEIKTDDPLLVGTFASGQHLKGRKFIRRIGGFRFASFTFIGKKKLKIKEQFYEADGDLKEEDKELKSFDIGFPKGVTVNEVFDWVKTWSKVSEIRRVRTPAGASYPINFGGGDSGGDDEGGEEPPEQP